MSTWVIIIGVLVGLPFLPLILAIIGAIIYLIISIVMADITIIGGTIGVILSELGILKLDEEENKKEVKNE